MAKARKIKKRIVAVTNTQKITRTMEMVATSRLKRYQKMVFASRPYSEALTEVLRGLITSPEAVRHPLMQRREEVKNAGIVVLSANRGLCGAFNNNICRKAQLLYLDLSKQNMGVKLYISGKKGISYFRHRDYQPDWQDTALPDDQSAEKTRELSGLLIDEFLAGAVDQVHVSYCRFVSAGRQEIVTEQLLPLTVTTRSSLTTSTNCSASSSFSARGLQAVTPVRMTIRRRAMMLVFFILCLQKIRNSLPTAPLC